METRHPSHAGRASVARALGAALATILAPGAWAQAPATAPTQDPTMTLGTVSIEATATGPLAARNVFSSVDILGAAVLQDQHVDYSWQLLSRAPGVQVDRGPIVCACFDVGLKTIIAAMAEQSLADVPAIGAALGAGTNCGSCRPALAKLLATEGSTHAA